MASRSRTAEKSDGSLHQRGNTRSRTVGDYVLGKTLGEGTFGQVMVAHHVPTQEKVAVKVLEKSRIKTVADIKRVNREIRILKHVRHGNVIQLYEVIDSPTATYFVTEHCDGGELFDYIVRNQRLKEPEASSIFRQLLDGVAYLHSLDITHRDLKPENLLLQSMGNRWRLKIIDFGLSNMSEKGRLLRTACGSPCYAAPEMIAGKLYKGPVADIWSIGVVLFTLIAGYLPFEDANTAALYRKILAGKYSCPDWLSDSSKDLLSIILDTNPVTRADMETIISHPWMLGTTSLQELPSLIPELVNDIDLEIIEKMTLIGMNSDYVKKSLIEGCHNNVCTTYNILLRRKLEHIKNSSNKQKMEPEAHKGNIQSGTFTKNTQDAQQDPTLCTANVVHNSHQPTENVTNANVGTEAYNTHKTDEKHQNERNKQMNVASFSFPNSNILPQNKTIVINKDKPVILNATYLNGKKVNEQTTVHLDAYDANKFESMQNHYNIMKNNHITTDMNADNMVNVEKQGKTVPAQAVAPLNSLSLTLNSNVTSAQMKKQTLSEHHKPVTSLLTVIPDALNSKDIALINNAQSIMDISIDGLIPEKQSTTNPLTVSSFDIKSAPLPVLFEISNPEKLATTPFIALSNSTHSKNLTVHKAIIMSDESELGTEDMCTDGLNMEGPNFKLLTVKLTTEPVTKIFADISNANDFSSLDQNIEVMNTDKTSNESLKINKSGTDMLSSFCISSDSKDSCIYKSIPMLNEDIPDLVDMNIDEINIVTQPVVSPVTNPLRALSVTSNAKDLPVHKTVPLFPDLPVIIPKINMPIVGIEPKTKHNVSVSARPYSSSQPLNQINRLTSKTARNPPSMTDFTPKPPKYPRTRLSGRKYTSDNLDYSAKSVAHPQAPNTNIQTSKNQTRVPITQPRPPMQSRKSVGISPRLQTRQSIQQGKTSNGKALENSKLKILPVASSKNNASLLAEKEIADLLEPPQIHQNRLPDYSARNVTLPSTKLSINVESTLRARRRSINLSANSSSNRRAATAKPKDAAKQNFCIKSSNPDVIVLEQKRIEPNNPKLVLEQKCANWVGIGA